MSDQALRKQLVKFLTKAQAHITLTEAIRGFPVDKAGVRPAGSPHSGWELLEHIRIALEDIARFSGVLGVSDGKPEGYVELEFPDGYWPPAPAPASPEDWKRSAAAIEDEMTRFLKLLEDPKQDLYAPFPWGKGQSLVRQALLIADHNAYHGGQLMLVRRMLEGSVG